ncbi:Lactosylceramide 1,3-N-acetyl-beta-D-glucosaminyltransferase A [Bagarius yarrelli]|uniref:Hexosyltransferase n=1 Tax=Bagarius yarrelli TaxID=175774 RepID=A0A556VVF5_BAGYA|nr:Lactosylceramide 1,3-N-acetyl-beta-D-glucosaminyltransferase A [Bagarius yarrelli]
MIMMIFVLFFVKVTWDSRDKDKSSDVKSYIFQPHNSLNFLKMNLTISHEEARKFSNHRYLINQRQKCTSEDVLLLLFVKSSPENFKRRRAIRSTWGNEAYIQKNFNVTVKVLFALGMKPQPLDRRKLQHMLFKEDLIHRDLIQQDFFDTFHNLTTKFLLQLTWTHTYCNHAHFIMSADDDIFIHTPNLIRYLQEINQADVKDFWVGNVNRGAPPNRNKDSKYYVSYEMYPWSLYPDYTFGAGYVFSRDVASKVYHASLTLNASLYIDDVFMGICASAMGISPQQHVFFSGDGKAPNDACIYKQMITSHGHVEDIHELWKFATDPELRRFSTGFFGRLYCTMVKIRHLCTVSNTFTYPCEAAFL